jgi:hypothetical protein
MPTVFDVWNQAGANVAPKPAPAQAPEYDENEVNPRFVGMELN